MILHRKRGCETKINILRRLFVSLYFVYCVKKKSVRTQVALFFFFIFYFFFYFLFFFLFFFFSLKIFISYKTQKSVDKCQLTFMRFSKPSFALAQKISYFLSSLFHFESLLLLFALKISFSFSYFFVLFFLFFFFCIIFLFNLLKKLQSKRK